jgi:hypothetical protein
VKFARKHLETIFTKSGSKKPQTDWAQHWPTPSQVFPDPMLMVSRNMTPSAKDWQYKGAKMHFIAWELWYPNILSQLRNNAPSGTVKCKEPKEAMPPCPHCWYGGTVGVIGWCKNPRRIVTLYGNDFLYIRRYRCTGCPNNKARYVSML